MRFHIHVVISLGIGTVALMAATPSLAAAPNELPAAPVIHRSQGELSEAAPYIAAVETKTSGDSIEVFIQGWRPTPCHKSQEIHVSQESESTKIVIRMQKSEAPAGQTCSAVLEPLKLKVADLPKTQKSSYKIFVLGNQGWHHVDLSHLMPAGL